MKSFVVFISFELLNVTDRTSPSVAYGGEESGYGVTSPVDPTTIPLIAASRRSRASERVGLEKLDTGLGGETPYNKDSRIMV